MKINYKKLEEDLQKEYRLFKISVIKRNDKLIEVIIIDEDKMIDILVNWFEFYDYETNIQNIINRINEGVDEEYV